MRLSQDQTKINLPDPRQRLGQEESHHCGEGQHCAGVEGGVEAKNEEIPETISEILSGSVKDFCRSKYFLLKVI